MPSGRPKGGTNKYWTPEEKEKIVLYHIENENISAYYRGIYQTTKNFKL